MFRKENLNKNKYSVSSRRITLHLTAIIVFLCSCATPDSNEQAKDVLENWCECMQKHSSVPSEAHRICTEKYREDLTSVMLLRSEEVVNDTSLAHMPRKSEDSLDMQKRKRVKFEQMGKFLQEMSKKCLDGL